MTTDIGLLHFSHAELACKGTGIVKLAEGFGQWIDEIRISWDKPLTVNSCCRSVEHNKAVGGVPNSYHLFDLPGRDFDTCAVDFAISANQRREFVAMILRKFPDASIGIAKTFVHVDRRNHYDGSPPTLFTYG